MRVKIGDNFKIDEQAQVPEMHGLDVGELEEETEFLVFFIGLEY
jgi:hypothetical protein